jgi:DnaJ-class molecular chaperone
MANKIKNQEFDPGRYRMVLCPECKGKGKLSGRDKKLFVCSLCGGFGFIKRENNISEQTLN